MNNVAIDRDLNQLALQVNTLVWITPFEKEEYDELYRAATLPSSAEGAKRKRVVPLPNFRDWAVRMYLGGAQRTFGLVKTENLPYALRFADMVRAYFWQYKQRGALPPIDTELNRRAAEVEEDLANETNAVALLARMEAHLRSIGAITTSDERIQKAKEKRRHGLRHFIANQHLDVMKKIEPLGEMADRLVSLTDKYETLLKDFDGLANEVNTQSGRLGELANRQSVIIDAINTQAAATRTLSEKIDALTTLFAKLIK